MINSTAHKVARLRSWIQIIPPGPLIFVTELRYWIKLVSSYCRTKSLAKPMPYPTVCRQKCRR